jgi:hypothetical protein
MGLNAVVMCNCFREAKTTRPPFPHEWLEVDDEGYFNLTKSRDSDKNRIRQHEWIKFCCEHEGMNLAYECVANWNGYRLFQAARAEVGWQHFPRPQAPHNGIDSYGRQSRCRLARRGYGHHLQVATGNPVRWCQQIASDVTDAGPFASPARNRSQPGTA